MDASQRRALGAGSGSAALLAAALAFQHLGGLVPCPMCVWQRWPHVVAILLAIVLLVRSWRPLALLAAIVMLVGAGLGLFHVGVEQGWWPGPDSCTAPDVAGLTPEELLEDILAAPVVRCDAVAWSFLGISMAGWNALASLGLAALWWRAYASSSASQ